IRSPLTQGRGSKRRLPGGLVGQSQSPLTQGRGSKHLIEGGASLGPVSPLTQGRGSKHSVSSHQACRGRVAPYAGARIETPPPTSRWNGRSSPLTQGRGSKRG